MMTNAVDLSTLQLMELHINTLFCSDSNGWLRCINELGEPPAPLFFMGRTLHGNFWRFRNDLPVAIVERVERLCQSEPLTADLATPPQNYLAIKAVIDEYVPHQEQKEYRGPAYWIPKAIPKDTQSMADVADVALANVMLISKSNAELLQPAFPLLLKAAIDGDQGPIAAAIEHDRAVSVCFCSRRPAQATEAGLETVEAFRGKGYATATVAAWAGEVSRLGCIPLYSTSWDNFASQAVARKLRMVMYGDDWSIR